jgi:hypothetical protein
VLGICETRILFEEKKIKLGNTILWEIKQIVKARLKTAGNVIVA